MGTPLAERPRTLRDAYVAARFAEPAAVVDLRTDEAVLDLRDQPAPAAPVAPVEAASPPLLVGDWSTPPETARRRRLLGDLRLDIVVGGIAVAVSLGLLLQWFLYERDAVQVVETPAATTTTGVATTTTPTTVSVTTSTGLPVVTATTAGPDTTLAVVPPPPTPTTRPTTGTTARPSTPTTRPAAPGTTAPPTTAPPTTAPPTTEPPTPAPPTTETPPTVPEIPFP